MQKYERTLRHILQDTDISTVGTVRINTRLGANLTGDPVLDTLHRSEETRHAARVAVAT